MAGFPIAANVGQLMQIPLSTRSPRASSGFVMFSPLRLKCALGRTGVSVAKFEGDGATPTGRFRLLRVYYRPDRLSRPKTQIPIFALRSTDGWCDASGDRNYNRHVRLPYPASHERLWRADSLYDIIIVIDYNITQRIQMRGSAIFIHVARAGYKPTLGCIALSRPDLLKLIALCNSGTEIEIGPVSQRGRRGLR
ncbi:MAG: L,D-transpeptidase family protein [Hyphomicrobiales bacterium]|nr:L,D-transpeptidase family protein [Hyphomicrobiales bacterium]